MNVLIADNDYCYNYNNTEPFISDIVLDLILYMFYS